MNAEKGRLSVGAHIRTHFGATGRIRRLRPLVVVLDAPLRTARGHPFRRIGIHPKDIEVIP